MLTTNEHIRILNVNEGTKGNPDRNVIQPAMQHAYTHMYRKLPICKPELGTESVFTVQAPPETFRVVVSTDHELK